MAYVNTGYWQQGYTSNLYVETDYWDADYVGYTYSPDITYNIVSTSHVYSIEGVPPTIYNIVSTSNVASSGSVSEALKCHIVAPSFLTVIAHEIPITVNIRSKGILTVGDTNNGCSTDLEDRVAYLEQLIADCLQARDIQPLFNNDIKEVIFHV